MGDKQSLQRAVQEAGGKQQCMSAINGAAGEGQAEAKQEADCRQEAVRAS
jgi:hypothetical protein